MAPLPTIIPVLCPALGLVAAFSGTEPRPDASGAWFAGLLFIAGWIGVSLVLGRRSRGERADQESADAWRTTTNYGDSSGGVDYGGVDYGGVDCGGGDYGGDGECSGSDPY